MKVDIIKIKVLWGVTLYWVILFRDGQVLISQSMIGQLHDDRSTDWFVTTLRFVVIEVVMEQWSVLSVTKTGYTSDMTE